MNNISVGLNFVDKAVIYRFTSKKAACYLLVICSQDVDERAEIELIIERSISVLTRGT